MTREEMLNECISRDKTIVQLSHLQSDWDDDWNVAIRKCIETIKVVPSVTPQPCEDCISRQAVLDIVEREQFKGDALYGIEKLPSVIPQPNPNIKALGEDIRICQKSITDKKVLIGFNMAVALCNKHLAESEE